MDILRKIPPAKDELSNHLICFHKYNIKSQIQRQTFDDFLLYWKEGKSLNINLNNVWEFFQLNDEFGLIQEIMDSPETKRKLKVSSLVNPSYYCNISSFNKKVFDKSMVENEIAQKLDEHLSEYSNDIFKIQINSLFNIFNLGMKNHKNHEYVYHRIIQEASNNKSIFILLMCLDAEKFKNLEIVEDSVLKKNEHLGFCPKNAEKILSNSIPSFIFFDKPLNIIVTGQSGEGKSVLINAIIETISVTCSFQKISMPIKFYEMNSIDYSKFHESKEHLMTKINKIIKICKNDNSNCCLLHCMNGNISKFNDMKWFFESILHIPKIIVLTMCYDKETYENIERAIVKKDYYVNSIIPVLAKSITFHIFHESLQIPSFGINNLILAIANCINMDRT